MENVQALIAENFGTLALLQMLIADSFGILAVLQASIAEIFVILALFQSLIADNCGIFNTLEKNNPHPGLEPVTYGITSRYIFIEKTVQYSTNCARN